MGLYDRPDFFLMERDGINDERPAECPDCGRRYMQEDCGGGDCPRCEEEEENLMETTTDEQLRDKWLAEFQAEGYAKFTAGIKEHNPDGTKGIGRMTIEQLAREMKNEAIDQYFYACALEDGIARRANS